MDRDRILVITHAEVANTVGGAITVFVDFCNMLFKQGFKVYGVYYNKISGKPQNLDKNINFSNLYEEYKGLNFSDSINKKIEDIKPVLIVFFFPYLCIEAKLSNTYKDIPRILMFHSRPDFYFAIQHNAEKELEPLYINTTSQVLFDDYQYKINLVVGMDLIRSQETNQIIFLHTKFHGQLSIIWMAYITKVLIKTRS